MIGGCVHDALYQMIRLGLIDINYKNDADILFYNILIRCKMWKFRADYYYQAVSIFGHYSCRVGDIKTPKIITLEF